MLRVAVIGLGKMGQHHARNLFRLQREGLVELVAVCDSDKTKERVAKEYSCEFYADYQEMLEREKPEAVSIAVPTRLHESVTKTCLQRGVHCLVEKPLSHSYESAKLLVDLAERNSVKLMVGHIERFNPVVQKLTEMVLENGLGELLSLHFRRIGVPRLTDIGVIVDLAIHDIDLALSFVRKEVEAVTCFARKKLASDFDDHAVIFLKFRGNTLAILETSRLAPVKVREVFIVGSKCCCNVDLVKQRIEVIESFLERATEWRDFKEFIEKFEPKRKVIEVKGEEPLYLELKSFVSSVIEDKEVVVPGSEALKALRIAELALRSAEEGKSINLA